MLRLTAGQDASLSFRRAAISDLGAVERLLAENDLPVAGVAGCIRDFILAESEGRVVGGIGLEVHGNHGLLRSAVVAKELQGKGVGRSLVERLLQLADARELESVHLLTTTAEDYFPRFGFVRVERTSVPDELMQSEELRGACPDTATVMRRSSHKSSIG